MKLFLDSEFTGLQQESSLISIGLVLDENHFFYAEFTDYDHTKLSVWHQENVIKNLIFSEKNHFVELSGKKIRMKGTILQIRKTLWEWFKILPKIEIWADVLAYDWVLFCNIFGDAFQIPSNIFYIPFDMATVLKIKGLNPDISRIEYAFEDEKQFKKYVANYEIEKIIQHNALIDAIVLKAMYEKVLSI
jgi:hypothetical protein